MVPGDRHEVVHGGLPRRARRDPAGRPAPYRRDRAGPTGYGSSPGRMCATGLPVLVEVDGSSYDTATRVRDLDPGLPIVDDLERIEGVVNSIADALDAPWLESLRNSSRSRRLSPAAFRFQLVEHARAADACVGAARRHRAPHRAGRGRVRVSEASPAACCWDRPTRSPVWPAASGCGCPLASVTVVDPQAAAERYVVPAGPAAAAQSGWTEEMARDHLADPIMVGTMMPPAGRGRRQASRGRGATTTAATVRPLLPILGTRARQPPGCRRCSSCAWPTRSSSTATAPSNLTQTPKTWPTSPSRAPPQRGPSASIPGSR